ncbi:MAG: EF-P lysine aminoacylase EpmA [Pseudomonadota bacterium]|nr:EF-P lysine aminoacylase EpmA [Pseudomonadota bacterium]
MLPAMMTAWHPDPLMRRLPHLKVRMALQQAIRDHFLRQDFLEVDTPILQVSPGMEPHIMAFSTRMIEPNPEIAATLYLHTSPEFAMKKLLAGGLPRIFQFAHVFRNQERSSRHSPEFIMLEWYRAGEGYTRLMEDCAALLRCAAVAGGRTRAEYNGLSCDLTAQPQVLTVAEAFRQYAGIDLLATAPDPLHPDTPLLAAEARRAGIAVRETDTWEDIFFRISLEKIEPHLGADRPVFLTEYPVSMAALSRPKPGDPRVAERFELYVCGLELANAFGELTDPVVQRSRFEADMALKERLYGVRYPVDADFMAALEHGLPESSGIALGFDRLAMLASGAQKIEDVLWLPVVRPS